MYGHERKAAITSLLQSQTSVNVNDLAKLLKTSKETIRRDLRELEEEGVLERTHGGAIAKTEIHTTKPVTNFSDNSTANQFPFAIRHMYNIPEKIAICKKAASLIKDRDTIFIDNSSSTLFLAQYIPKDIHVTIITNSIKVLSESAALGNPNFTLIALAGFYNAGNFSMYGSRAIKSAEDFFPNKTFISCTGLSETGKLTDISLNEVDIKQALMQKSDEVFVLIDHTKFGAKGPFYLSNFENVDYIITDKFHYEPQISEMLHSLDEKYSIKVIVSDAVEED